MCKNDKYIPASLEQDMLIHVPETLVAQMIWKDNPDNFNSMVRLTKHSSVFQYICLGLKNLYLLLLVVLS